MFEVENKLIVGVHTVINKSIPQEFLQNKSFCSCTVPAHEESQILTIPIFSHMRSNNLTIFLHFSKTKDIIQANLPRQISSK